MEQPLSSLESSHLDETVQVSTESPDDAGSVDCPDGDCRPAVALVDGTGPAIESQTNRVVERRMRIASLMLFSAFIAFLIRTLFVGESDFGLTFWAHVAMTSVTGMVGFRLCMECPKFQRHIRLAEVAVFGGSAVFFAIYNHSAGLEGIAEGVAIPFLPPWLTLIFTYALMIPNSWKRAGIVIGLMATLALGVQGYLLFSEPRYSEILANSSIMSLDQLAMALVLNSVIAVWGVGTINQMRQKVYEAEQLGQYRLRDQIGQGGMGEVYLAEHLLLKRPCAIKLIRPEQAGDVKALARFEREVQATAKLSHWNTVEIFDYGRTDDGTFYYVMEYLPGMNLSDLVNEFGKIPSSRVIHLLAQVCEALGEAHDHGMVHRDIKPGNIFAAIRGGLYDVAKLLDFGLVKPLTSQDENISLTQEGAITGSPLFMSPEQATGDKSDARSDIYALGAVAYFMATGQPPFDSVVPIKVILAHSTEAPKPPSEVADGIPGDLENVILTCLEKKPGDRYQTTGELRQALLQCETANQWTRSDAADWWQNHGCPKKKALDQRVLEAAGA